MKLVAIRKIKALKNKGNVLQLMEIKSRYILLEIRELKIIKRTNRQTKQQISVRSCSYHLLLFNC